MEKTMDRRQRKTRQAIFAAFTQLLSQKDFGDITVGEIIATADVGRATFYAHFETKDYLLKEFCEELFCHLFDAESAEQGHHHIFHCDGSDSVFLHLFRHLQRNDNNILLLLSSKNNELFLKYFKHNLEDLVQSHLSLFASRRSPLIHDSFWAQHIIATFTQTLTWWLSSGMEETPEEICQYFFAVV